MHCPNCGTETSSEHRFCRSCGLSLEKFALLLAEQLPAGADGRAQAEELARLAARERRVEFWLGIAAFTFITLVVGVVLWGIIGKIIIEKGQVLGGLAFLCTILLGLASVGLVVYRESLKEKLQKRPEFLPSQTGATGRLLPESRFEPVPSVTDTTTELLAAGPRKSGRQQAEGSQER